MNFQKCNRFFTIIITTDLRIVGQINYMEGSSTSNSEYKRRVWPYNVAEGTIVDWMSWCFFCTKYLGVMVVHAVCI